MTVNEFYIKVDGINICRIASWEDYLKCESNNHTTAGTNIKAEIGYLNLYYVEPNKDINFGIYSKEVLETYGNCEIRNVEISSVDNRIVATLYVN